jgi:hypothetical protein
MLFKKSTRPVSPRCGHNFTGLVVTISIRLLALGRGNPVDNVLDRWMFRVFFVAHDVDPSGGRTSRGGRQRVISP